MSLERSLRVLGVQLRIRSDSAALVEPFLAVFASFVEGNGQGPQTGERAAAGAGGIDIEIDDHDGEYRDGRRRVALAAGRLRGPHVYNLLYTTLVRSLEGAYLLHAAVVAHQGRAWVISGPSGSGKTSLGRELVKRGFGFLSDDLAPLDIGDGRIHPFPRRIGLIPDAATPEMKMFVPAESLGGEVVTEALPPGGVVLMNPYADDDPERVPMTVAVLGGAAGLRQSLASVDGVDVDDGRPVAGLTILELSLAGAAAIAAVETQLDRADADVMFHLRGYGKTKRYAGAPVLTPISTRDAAVGLLRETLNREPSSALMQRHGGRAGAALFELFSLLAQVPCYHLTPGSIQATVDLLAATFDDPAGR